MLLINGVVFTNSILNSRIVVSVHRKCLKGETDRVGEIGILDNETSRKPVVSAADAAGYGESTGMRVDMVMGRGRGERKTKVEAAMYGRFC